MKYILHWLDGQTQEIYGNSISDALSKAGYGHGVFKALDYYEEVNRDTNQEDISLKEDDSLMPTYSVSWKIDVEAPNHIEAAKKALLIQRDRGSAALIFEVYGPYQSSLGDEFIEVTVDLNGSMLDGRITKLAKAHNVDSE